MDDFVLRCDTVVVDRLTMAADVELDGVVVTDEIDELVEFDYLPDDRCYAYYAQAA